MSQTVSPSSPGPSAVSPSKPQAKAARGTSIFPTARVARIIKADRDVDICSKEATFLISVATEIFLKRLTDEAYTNAKLDKRKNVLYKDLSRAVQQNEYLEFLKDAIPTPVALSTALEARQQKSQQRQLEEEMILEGTLQQDDEDEQEEEEEEEEDEDEDEDEDEQEQEQEQEREDEDAAEEEATDDHADQDRAEEQDVPADDHSTRAVRVKTSSKKSAPKKSKSRSKFTDSQDDVQMLNDTDQDDQ